VPAAAEPPAPPWGETDDADLGPPLTPSASDSLADVAPEELPTVGHIGRYALKYRIGAGGTGTVYAAQDPLLSRLIAIKTLNVEIPDEQRESFNAMFLREARAAAGLSHPHIVTVFDAGISDSGAYIAMELLKGRDLRQLCADGWRPTPVQAAQVVRRVADALAYAHGKGVVHRDIKPANIFMVGRTQPRVLDFGIARVTHQHDGQPEDDIAGGSPYYMAPEQVMQQATDLRADVFSLGVVLYELLAGQRPFGGESLLEIGRAVLDHEPPPAHEVNPAAPAALAAIAVRAMAKKPEDRYRSARMLSRELRHWLDEHAAAASPPALPARRELERRRRAAFGGAAVSAGVLALLGAGTWLYRSAAADHAAIAAATQSANPAVIATLPPTGAAPPAVTVAAPAPVEEII
jgi:serine/threonine protein kinase